MDKKSGLSDKMEDYGKSKRDSSAQQPEKKPIARRKQADAEPKVIAVHTLKDNETWSHLALRYYGDMSEPYWRYMYEFNKEMVGDNYKSIWGGMEIRIPELPDHLKKDEE